MKGTQYKVNTPGQNNTWYILGSLEYPKGDGLYEIYEHKLCEALTQWLRGIPFERFWSLMGLSP